MKTQIAAEPQPITVELDRTALVIIDMQRDFLEPGGFGETLGNDVSLLQAAVGPCKAVLDAARASRHAGRSTPARVIGPDLSDAPPAKIERGSPSQRIGDPGPMGRILVRGEPGHDIIPELYPIAGEPVIDKPGKGAFYATDLELDAAQLRHRESHRLRRHHRSLRQHHRARGQRPRLSLRRARRLLRARTFPEFHEMGLKMIKAQGGIFGWVSDSKKMLARSCRRAARPACSAAPKLGGADVMSTIDDIQTDVMDAGRLERLLRLRHQHPGQHAGADRPAALRPQDAGRTSCSAASCRRSA